MKVRNISMVIATLMIGVQTFAQSPFPENLLGNRGPVPEDFYEPLTNRLLNRIEEEGSTRMNRDEKAFYKQTEYSISRMLQNGNVYYGDEVSEYVSEVVDIILKDHPELRSKLRVYTHKKTDFNASVSANGIIFVNTGMMAQLQNEAELAALLSHEIAHYIKKHSKEKFMEYVRLNKTVWAFDLDRREENLLSMLDYSKAKEFEADEVGYTDFFEKSGYRKGAIIDLMDVMLYSYLPFDEIKFDASLFEIPGFSLPAECKISEVKAVTAYEDYDDEKSTHPNIKSRKDALQKLVRNPKEGEYFLVSKERFEHIRTLCRIENTRLYLKERKPARAIYNAFLLMQNFPDNPYIEKHYIHAIYMASLYKNYFKLNDIVKEFDDVEGYSQEVFYILNKMEAEALNTIAVRKAFEYIKKHPEDRVMKKVFEDAVWELTFIHDKRLHEYADLPEPTDSAQIAKIEEEEDEEEEASGKLSKVAKLKKQKEEIGYGFDTRYAFTGLLDDELFKETFAEKLEEKDRRKKELPYKKDGLSRAYVTWKDIRDPTSHYNRYRSRYNYPESDNDSKGGLGLDSVMVLTPMYIKVDPYTAHKILPLRSDKSLAKFSGYLDQVSNLVGLHIEKFDYASLNSSLERDESYFSDIQILQEWLNERSGHKGIELVPASAHLVEDIVEKYKINHLVFTGVFASREDLMGLYNFSTVIGPLLNPFTLPVQILYSADRTYKTINFFVTYDLLTGRVVYSNVMGNENHNYEDKLKGKLYADLLMLKTPKL